MGARHIAQKIASQNRVMNGDTLGGVGIDAVDVEGFYCNWWLIVVLGCLISASGAL